MSGSEKHLRDITGDQVDYAYIAEWVSRMKLEPIWEAIRERTSD